MALADANRHEAARRMLERFLAKRPDDVEGRTALARVLAKLGKSGEAAVEFSRAISLSSPPKPDLYVERSEALAAAHRIEDAIRGLDEGIQKLGPLVSLEEPAIDLELRRKNFGAALARVDRMAALSPRRETWLARRGGILLASGRRWEAVESLRQAQRAIELLPPRMRETRAMERLENRIRSQLRGGKSDAKS